MLSDATRIAIIVRKRTIDRLKTTCFRGPSFRMAGNFFLWNSVESLFIDMCVLQPFLFGLDEDWENKEFGTQGISIDYPENVGWESTSPIEKYSNDDLEQFNLNRKSWGLRVKASRGKELLAPLTNLLTLVYEFRSEGEMPVAIVHSVYPGRDIGELYGDVTSREGRIFFDWSHPGERS